MLIMYIYFGIYFESEIRFRTVWILKWLSFVLSLSKIRHIESVKKFIHHLNESCCTIGTISLCQLESLADRFTQSLSSMQQ